MKMISSSFLFWKEKLLFECFWGFYTKYFRFRLERDDSEELKFLETSKMNF